MQKNKMAELRFSGCLSARTNITLLVLCLMLNPYNFHTAQAAFTTCPSHGHGLAAEGASALCTTASSRRPPFSGMPVVGPHVSLNPISFLGSKYFPAVGARAGAARFYRVVRLRMSDDSKGVKLGDGDVQEESAWLATDPRAQQEEIRQWLDDEWIPREIHRTIGDKAAQSYSATREKGDNDVGSILIAVADDLATFDFYEADVNAWDIANKVSDLLLIRDGRPVCCTTQPYSMPEVRGKEEGNNAGAVVPAEVGIYKMPETTIDKYFFLQQILDERIDEYVWNRAVLETLGYKLTKVENVGFQYDSSAVEDIRWVHQFPETPDFTKDIKAVEFLDKVLQERLEDANKRETDLDPLIEALYGEALLEISRVSDIEFMKREACVKWLHFAGGY